MAKRTFRPTQTNDGQPYVAMPLGVHTGGMPNGSAMRTGGATRAQPTPTISQMKSSMANQNYLDAMESGGNAGSL